MEQAPRVLCVWREPVFSPNMVEQDQAILSGVGNFIENAGGHVSYCDAPVLASLCEVLAFDLILAMCQSPAAVARLTAIVDRGRCVINSPSAIWNCYRARMLKILLMSGIPVPPSRCVDIKSVRVPTDIWGRGGIWLKRADFHSIGSGEVVHVSDPDLLRQMIQSFYRRGMTKLVVQDHVIGETVKFYGLSDGSFFHVYNDHKSVTDAVRRTVRDTAMSSARALDLAVFGGDTVVSPTGNVTIVDLNDWPSFGACAAKAAAAIGGYALNQLTCCDLDVALPNPHYSR